MRSKLRELLTGGDRRSLARSNQARRLVEADRRLVAELARLAKDDDWLVSLRALDLLEKLLHDHIDWLRPYKRVFIGSLADSERWEIRLQIVRALPLLRWSAKERERVVTILRRDLDHPQKFVQAWALDSLATLARQDAVLLPDVMRKLAAIDRSPSRALRARARRIRERLGVT